MNLRLPSFLTPPFKTRTLEKHEKDDGDTFEVVAGEKVICTCYTNGAAIVVENALRIIHQVACWDEALGTQVQRENVIAQCKTVLEQAVEADDKADG